MTQAAEISVSVGKASNFVYLSQINIYNYNSKEDDLYDKLCIWRGYRRYDHKNRAF